MKKKIRLFVKQEKRIVQLLYKKGYLNQNNFRINDINLNNLYWAEYTECGKSKKRNNKYKTFCYYPEIFYSTVDYFGECDEDSIVSNIKDLFYWNNCIVDENEKNITHTSSFKFKSRNWFIKYLTKLPTVNYDNKIKTVLIKKINY